ncbi:MAG: hypothetical protein PHS53_01945 [Candidatus Pacebacteria bacterium]|nr:hypothetical protein [Candidatus Paceibacterota bacterium]MDD5356888.1 hypothetical protein [Candidatus Paceibacterota bacterium]
MSEEPVTLPQGQCVQKIANDKHVGRVAFQQALDDGRFARFLDGLKMGEYVPPKGARIEVVRIRFKPDRQWQEAITKGGSNTAENFGVRKVGDQYSSIDTEEIEECLILLNCPKDDGNWDKALAWAEGAGLKRTVPCEVSAIGENHFRLHTKHEMAPVSVVATECIVGKEGLVKGDRLAFCVWLDASERKSSLFCVESLDDVYCWFAFRK